ncbi:branched-chain amino acid ABC transporter substrate-binding protein [Ectothiorhodospiraceae bacterium WFHF3C12]|nr:branched-chain amino acid ABC transporter substrate-binding protein [Ectothiorhodospiraceae bacterium WFHF3C12]
MKLRRYLMPLFTPLLLGAALGTTAQAADKEPIRIAYIDPLSGPFANVGDLGFKHYAYLADWVNDNGGIDGHKLEIVPMDNKNSPQESLVALQRAADQGINYVTQGLGSHVAGALISGVNKHNRRNPDNRIAYINYAAQNPKFYNELCSYWHIGLDANLEMKMNAITDYVANSDDIEKVFFINQDYSYGQGWSRVGKRMLEEKAPDVEVVGDVLHPIGKVKDFSPYVSQIKSAGADAVITGNWGNDLTLLIKAGADAGLDVKYFTQAAGGLGAPTAIGQAGDDKVFLISTFYSDLPRETETPQWLTDFIQGFEERHAADNYYWYYTQMLWIVQMLEKAVEQTGTTEPAPVIAAMEEMRHSTPYGDVWIRNSDHQFLQPLYLSKYDDAAEVKLEGTEIGLSGVAEYPPKQTAVPTDCSMDRPE